MKTKLGYLTTKEEKVIRAFVRELRNDLGNDLLTVRIFGSKIKGDFTKYSDIDLFILIKKKNLREKISDLAAEYLFKYNVLLSPVVYSLFEYKENKRLGSFFFEKVEKEGIPL
ncbi:MAG: nucleotidyltransferase domain-containing protein [bacterium]